MSREKKYTQGPWKYDGKVMRCADGAIWFSAPRTPSEIEANAFLAAAAPELLEALEELLESCPCDPDTTNRFLQANKNAERAIAKAYGEKV